MNIFSDVNMRMHNYIHMQIIFFFLLLLLISSPVYPVSYYIIFTVNLATTQGHYEPW